MHAGFCSVHHHNPLCWQVPHEHPGVNAAPRCSRTPLSMTSILLTRAFQKCVFSLAADSRRQHRSGYLVSAFYSQLELKWEKKHQRGRKIRFLSAALRTQSTCVSFGSKALQRGAHLLPGHPSPLPRFSTCQFCWCSSLWESFLEGRNVPLMCEPCYSPWSDCIQTTEGVKSGIGLGVRGWEEPGAVKSAGQSSAVGLCCEPSPEYTTSQGLFVILGWKGCSRAKVAHSFCASLWWQALWWHQTTSTPTASAWPRGATAATVATTLMNAWNFWISSRTTYALVSTKLGVF